MKVSVMMYQCQHNNVYLVINVSETVCQAPPSISIHISFHLCFIWGFENCRRFGTSNLKFQRITLKCFANVLGYLFHRTLWNVFLSKMRLHEIYSLSRWEEKGGNKAWLGFRELVRSTKRDWWNFPLLLPLWTALYSASNTPTQPWLPFC